MHLCLFEDNQVRHLSPVTRTRGVYQIRTGAFSNMIRLWEIFGQPALSLHARSWLADLISSQTGLPVNQLPEEESILFLNGRITSCAEELINTLKEISQSNNGGRVFTQGETLVAAWVPNLRQPVLPDYIDSAFFGDLPVESINNTVTLIDRLSHLVDGLQSHLHFDLGFLTKKKPEPEDTSLHDSVTVVNQADIFVAQGANIHPGAILNAEEGPIFIDSDAQVMESAIVKGPVYLGKRSVIKPRADIAISALGPVCKAGGEVKETIFQSFSNKAHEGFLGHAYMGSWCNIGAGTNASNLKNDYSETALYNEALGLYEKTGRQFLGVIMADHSKIGISSMINTATVIGVCCNLFGSGFLPRHLPSFTWGGQESGFEPYRLDKAFEAMQRVMVRRNRALSDAAARQLERIYRETHEEVAI